MSICFLRAGHVYEHIIGEDKYTFVEECHNPASVTILIKAPNKYTITQVKVKPRLFSFEIPNTFSKGLAFMHI